MYFNNWIYIFNCGWTRVKNKREIYFYSNRIIIVVDNCLFPILIDFISMMAPSRRVRVSRIKHKRKILRLLLTISSRQQKGVFLLVVDIWLYEVRILARSNER